MRLAQKNYKNVINDIHQPIQQSSLPKVFSTFTKMIRNFLFLILLITVVLFAKVIGKAVGNTSSKKPLASNSQTNSTQIDKILRQSIGTFSVNYSFPFLHNEKESNDIIRKRKIEAPEWLNMITSYNTYMSTPSCGLAEVRLDSIVYNQGFKARLDQSANGAVNRVLSRPGITNPESYIVSTTISDYPARMISYRGKRFKGVIGGEAAIVYNDQTNTLWILHLIFGTRDTNDYSRLEKAQFCAQKILKSIAITQS